MSGLGFLGLGLFIIGILFAVYVVTHLDQIWNIFENVFGKIESFTEKMSVTPPASAEKDWLGNDRFTIDDIIKKYNITDHCASFINYHWDGAGCQTLANTLEIIKQNKVIIQQNIQILKNQEIIKCQNIYKDTRDYIEDEFFGSELADKPSKLIAKCGK